ncbi:MAG TPA: AAA family ATPase [Fimbriimonadaceae bacterium]|nr:AAA family ATPase [Fimbriimonadaceae bacterium]
MKYNITSLDQLKTKSESRPVSFVVEDLIDLGSFVILGGAPKDGKTAIATNLAFSVATGKPFLGKRTSQSPVLWLTFEESESERWLLCQHYDNPAPIHHVMNPDPIDTEEGIANLRETIEATKSKLVIIDALAGAVICESLTEMVKARKALDPLNKLRIDLDVTVLLLHHHNKGFHQKGSANRMADSHQIVSICSQFWNLDHKRVDGGRLVTLEGRGRHSHGDRPIQIWSPNEHTFCPIATAGQSGKKVETQTVRTRILKSVVAGQYYTARQIAQLLGVPGGSVKNVLTGLVADGSLLSQWVSGQRCNSYCLAESAKQDAQPVGIAA